jgi:catechol 2,3-dioxygenase-like lactoylglutathione lyase family enzyme
MTPDNVALLDWYVARFGLAPRPRGTIATTADAPNLNISFSRSQTALAGTKGRSVDHIGFEVKNLPEFLERMEAEGVTITQGLTPSNFVSTMRVAFIADPWGTRMEITEGIAPQP